MLNDVLIFVILSLLEIVLGVDNIIFIAMIVNEIPANKRKFVRMVGVSLAMLFRVVSLYFISFMSTIAKPFAMIGVVPVSCRSLLFLFGGMFLLYKMISELYEIFHSRYNNNTNNSTDNGGNSGDSSNNGEGGKNKITYKSARYAIVQIIFIDLVLSIDSIITAIGVTGNKTIIIAAIVVSMIAMMFSVNAISEFIAKNVSVKVLGVCIIGLIGVYLILEGAGVHVDKNSVYSAIFFAIFVECVNLKCNSKKHLHKSGPS